tara:strand:- start:777 stop:1385 length:609 start_codon:yes stop_codon:yes gene_type:complete
MNNKWKWISIGTVGSLFALSHIGMIGMISRQSKFPQLNLPVGEYTSYSVRAGKDGYAINYRANDPLIMHVERESKTKGGFLGLGNNVVRTKEQYTVGGKTHHGGPVSNHNTWIDPSAQGKGLSAKTIECIKARGSGEGTGRMVGGSVGATLGSSLSGVPFIGWVLTGAASMIGMDTGADIGGSMAESYAGCTELNENGEETS